MTDQVGAGVTPVYIRRKEKGAAEIVPFYIRLKQKRFCPKNGLPNESRI